MASPALTLWRPWPHPEGEGIFPRDPCTQVCSAFGPDSAWIRARWPIVSTLSAPEREAFQWRALCEVMSLVWWCSSSWGLIPCESAGWMELLLLLLLGPWRSEREEHGEAGPWAVLWVSALVWHEVLWFLCLSDGPAPHREAGGAWIRFGGFGPGQWALRHALQMLATAVRSSTAFNNRPVRRTCAVLSSHLVASPLPFLTGSLKLQPCSWIYPGLLQSALLNSPFPASSNSTWPIPSVLLAANRANVTSFKKDNSWNPNTWTTSCEELILGKSLMLERLKAREKGVAEDEIVGWHHRLNRHKFEQTLGDSKGQGSPESPQTLPKNRERNT